MFSFKSGWCRLATPFRLHCLLVQFIGYAATALLFAIVCSTVRPPKRGFPRPNCHNHGFTSYTLLPTFHPQQQSLHGKPEIPPLNPCAC